ncbi:MAG: hypothetical protein ABI721_03755 [Candidatus Dojkabacteria bacterium]
MSVPTLKERLEEVLESKNIVTDSLKIVDKDSIDELCFDLGINVVEKAYILGFEVEDIFNPNFVKGLAFLELDSKGVSFDIWKTILNIKAD